MQRAGRHVDAGDLGDAGSVQQRGDELARAAAEVDDRVAPQARRSTAEHGLAALHGERLCGHRGLGLRHRLVVGLLLDRRFQPLLGVVAELGEPRERGLG